MQKLWLQEHQCLPPHVPPFPTGIKSLINEENNDNPETTYTSRIYKYDTSHTNLDDSIENKKDMKNPMIMTKTKRILSNTKTVMNVLSTQPNKNENWLNGWYIWISNIMSYNTW